jgi:putative addiction module component (TIGR02574 family)
LIVIGQDGKRFSVFRAGHSHRAEFFGQAGCLRPNLEFRLDEPVGLPSHIRELPVLERLALIEQIWESIVEDEATFPLTAAQKAELDQRLVRLGSTVSRGSSWNEVKGRILGES